MSLCRLAAGLRLGYGCTVLGPTISSCFPCFFFSHLVANSTPTKVVGGATTRDLHGNLVMFGTAGSQSGWFLTIAISAKAELSFQ